MCVIKHERTNKMIMHCKIRLNELFFVLVLGPFLHRCLCVRPKAPPWYPQFRGQLHKGIMYISPWTYLMSSTEGVKGSVYLQESGFCIFFSLLSCCSVIFLFFSTALIERGSPIQWGTLWPVFTPGHTPGLVREHTSSVHSSSAAFLCIDCAFSLGRMGKNGSHRPAANELTYLGGFLFLLKWVWCLSFMVFTRSSAVLNTKIEWHC